MAKKEHVPNMGDLLNQMGAVADDVNGADQEPGTKVLVSSEMKDDKPKEEEPDRAAELAKEIMLLCRNILLVNMRYLDTALSQFEYEPTGETMATDGKHMYFHPWFVLMNYKMERNVVTRNYLHMVMHCIFRHMYVDPDAVNQYAWDLACDIAVENVINELGLQSVECGRVAEQAKVIYPLKAKLKTLTAEKIYHYYVQQVNEGVMTNQDLVDTGMFLIGDDHGPWYNIVSEGEGSGNDDENRRVHNNKEQEEVWKQISEQVETDLETFSKEHEGEAGALIQNIMSVNRENYDFSTFLKKFSVLGEVMKINDDEFDYIFYTYGLKLYHNMPLVEALEYREEKRVKDFVIAIDTSGSVSGDLVQSFIQKTFNILKEENSFFQTINLHLIQCDNEIQEDVKITNQDELDAYLETMQLRGFGGTNFVPVFDYVEQLIEDKEFLNLRGMVYFTDGYGTFPDHKPPFETAFVFVNDDYSEPDVPPWAIKLVLQSYEILSGNF